ncbi:hypothetical protein E9549_20340 [Blastococcus sp. MG754426]|nr:hypothetical protein [Blastococcus sp. MG754426]MCF6514117.1 hypothetical protein [Blastococcus sp. MG754427]
MSPLSPAGWFVTLYPGAGEVGGSFRYSVPVQRSPGGGDPERSKEEAARRAARKVRRYCAHNRLNRLGTLTYRGSGCHDPRLLRRDLSEFFRVLRKLLGGTPFAYLWVPEWHKTDHGLHVHFAVGRFVARGLIERAWGHGFVHIKRLSAPSGSTAAGLARDEARIAARYLSKYVRKGFDARRIPGLHRYEVAQRFQPETVRLRGRTFEDVMAQAAAAMGGDPDEVWTSDQSLAWQGPPALWAIWR